MRKLIPYFEIHAHWSMCIRKYFSMNGFKFVFLFIFHGTKLKKACRNDKPFKYETAVLRIELSQVVPPTNIFNFIFHYANII